MSIFDPKSPADIAALVREFPLATLLSNGPDGFAATPLPLIAEHDSDGRIVALIGHFARSNAQLAGLRDDPRAMAVFHGPHAYVSPRIVSKPGWAPTWNYAVVRFQLAVTLTPERNDDALRLLAEALEGTGPDAWHPGLIGERYDRLVAHIVAFRAEVLATHATFKLGQDEDAASFAEIVEEIGDDRLAQMMVGQRPG
jgi:transcriptional regulator